MATNGTTGTLRDELAALRTGAGLVDRSDVGRLRITGADALDLLNRLTTNKLEELPDGQSLLTVLTNGNARVIDLLALGALDGGVLCLTSPGHVDTVVDWLDTYTFGEEIDVVDRTAATFQLTLGGPDAAAVLGADADGLRIGELRAASVGGASVILWRMLAGGADGYEIVGDVAELDAVRAALTAAGATPVSAGSWEAYRIANGMPVAGAEFGAFTNPLESRLLGAISEDKGCYTGQEVIARLMTYRKVQRKLMAVELSGPAEAGATLERDGKSSGVLTSVAETEDGFVGLALVAMKSVGVGDVLDVAPSGGSPVTATLRDPAFALATEPANA